MSLWLKRSSRIAYLVGQSGLCEMDNYSHNFNERKAGIHMERVYSLNGKKVYADFPKISTDTNLMPHVLEILISSYLANGYREDKNVSLAKTA